MDHTLLRDYQLYFSDTSPDFHVFSPYGVCPLGAHVDHQHGLVTGFALDKGIDFVFSVTDDGEVEIVSLQYSGVITFNVKSRPYERQYNWGDYLRGALWAVHDRYPLDRGVRGIVRGSIPSGGIASSAALLCGFIAAIAQANRLQLQREEIVELASKAERSYVGLSSGVLDQSCVMFSQKNQLLFLDTDTGESRLVPFGGAAASSEMLPFKIAIFYSGVTRSLTNTDYNIRVEECQTAASILQAYGEKHSCVEDHILRRASRAAFDQYAPMMPPRFARRARHFFTECERVEEGTEAWQVGDIGDFGELMFESCESSILNYECGSPQLIALYRILRNCPGVYGARFCGTGFVGSCFALINPETEGAIREQVTLEYLQQFPMYRDSFRSFVCQSGGAACIDWPITP